MRLSKSQGHEVQISKKKTGGLADLRDNIAWAVHVDNVEAWVVEFVASRNGFWGKCNYWYFPTTKLSYFARVIFTLGRVTKAEKSPLASPFRKI